ncbi:hypothetical protein BU17DRAFT_48119 [Hysterangium stoloniferum]|nr:hypothetical protein BU17DRAFT_48119 [Hysterangium stoloniferum]
MDARDPPGSVVDWDEEAVITWLSNLGFTQYDQQIREHNISGEVLTFLDQETLKEVGVSTIGQRLAILKAVYYLKLAHNIPIDSEHYVPPSEVDDDQEGVTLESLHEIVKEQAERLRQLEHYNQALQSDLRICLDELGAGVRSAAAHARSKPLTRQPSYKWTDYSTTPIRSPTKAKIEAEIESPKVSPSVAEHDISSTAISSSKASRDPQSLSERPSTSRLQTSTTGNGHSPNNSSSNLVPTPKTTRTDNAEGLKDGLKSFKVSLEDPAWKVLPAALKKYKINNDDWQNYAMFICYGSTERCLSYDEKPLLLFQKLKDAKKNPVFMLKHIRDIRSPIVVAQQKQAARQMAKASEAAMSPNPASASSSHPPKAGNPRVAALSRQQSLRGRETPTQSGITPSGGWPASDIMSPSVEKPDEDRSRSSVGTEDTLVDGTVIGRDIVPAPNDISYAVAIYPYMAEQEDEFDVVVSDSFIILQRARGWWVVQRDPTGSGVVENDPSKQGWVPAGCLLETNVPVASAVAEATGGKITTDGKPILPLSIISTSFPGIALMDYTKKGDEELDLKKDDALRVFKRYNHWSYAVKEDGGARGWVPSWFIGKVAGAVPPTPNTATPPMNGSGSVQVSASMLEPDIRYGDSGLHTSESISPVSPGFPPAATPRATTVI